jgi:hypothetical protein
LVHDPPGINEAGHFLHAPITTLIAPAFKNFCIWSFLEAPTDFCNHFWIQVAASLLKRPLRNRFGSEAVIINL